MRTGINGWIGERDDFAGLWRDAVVLGDTELFALVSARIPPPAPCLTSPGQ